MKKIPASELGNIKMVQGNENKYSMVIQNDHLREWVGIGWITIRLATDEDKKNFPTVEYDQ